MKNKNELSYKDLKMTCNPEVFKFNTTEELEPIQTGIGQDRGIKALEFGIQVDVKGYNLYLEGPSGVGKTMYTKNYLDKIASKRKHLLTGVISIILIIQMNQLLSLCQLVKESNLKMIWMVYQRN